MKSAGEILQEMIKKGYTPGKYFYDQEEHRRRYPHLYQFKKKK